MLSFTFNCLKIPIWHWNGRSLLRTWRVLARRILIYEWNCTRYHLPDGVLPRNFHMVLFLQERDLLKMFFCISNPPKFIHTSHMLNKAWTHWTIGPQIYIRSHLSFDDFHKDFIFIEKYYLAYKEYQIQMVCWKIKKHLSRLPSPLIKM